MAKVYVRATYDFESNDPQDLTFKEGDVIMVLEQDGDWWKGRHEDGRQGMFPFNRIKKINNYPGFGSSSKPVMSKMIGQSGEEVVSVSIKVDDTQQSQTSCSYNIDIALRNGQRFRSVKSMTDFRLFDNAVTLLNPNYQFKVGITPEWADLLPVPVQQAKDRADLLERYLKLNKDMQDAFQLLIAAWAKSSPSTLGSSNGDCRITPSDKRADVERKINAALARAKGMLTNDAFRYFFGKQKLGDLVQSNYQWDARDNSELAIVPSDYILVTKLQTEFEGWWYGEKIDGTQGYFPSNYVVKIEQRLLEKRLKSSSPSPSPQVRQTRPTMEERPPASYNESSSEARDRRVENNFWVKSIEAYDELKTQGFTIERNNQHMKVNVNAPNGSAKNNDFVTIRFNAYVWDPQTQQLREFSATDKLKRPPKGVETGAAGASGIKMEFVLGSEDAIEGLERVCKHLRVNERVRAIISPSMGYGSIGSPPEIPPDCYLVYDLELEKVTGGTQYRPPRNQIFSVGITRNNIEQRAPMTSGAMYASSRQHGVNGGGARRKKRRGKQSSQGDGY